MLQNKLLSLCAILSLTLFFLISTNTHSVLAEAVGWQSGEGFLYTQDRIGIGSEFPTTVLSLNKKVGGFDIGITQNQVGGWHTFEATTGDATGEQATRMLLRGSSNLANIEFYTGARGEEQLTTIITGEGKLGVGEATPEGNLHVSGGNGPVRLVLEADEDNDVETDQPSIYFSQDGGKKDAEIGFVKGKNDFRIQNSSQGAELVLLDDGRICIGNC